MRCKECENILPQGESKCVTCGAESPSANRTAEELTKMGGWLSGLGFLGVVIAVLFFNFINHVSTSNSGSLAGVLGALLIGAAAGLLGVIGIIMGLVFLSTGAAKRRK